MSNEATKSEGEATKCQVTCKGCCRHNNLVASMLPFVISPDNLVASMLSFIVAWMLSFVASCHGCADLWRPGCPIRRRGADSPARGQGKAQTGKRACSLRVRSLGTVDPSATGKSATANEHA